MSKKPSREQRKKSNERELKKIARGGATALRPIDASPTDGGPAQRTELAASPTKRERPIVRARKPSHEQARDEATRPREPAAPKKPKKGQGRGAIMLMIAALVAAGTLFVYLQYRPTSPKGPETKGDATKPESAAGRLADLPTGPPIDSSPPTIVTAAPPTATPPTATPPPTTPPTATAVARDAKRVVPAVEMRPLASSAPVAPAVLAPKPAPALAAPKKAKSDDPYN